MPNTDQVIVTGDIESNKVPVNIFYEAFNTRNLSLLDKALAENWDDIPLAPGQAPGLAGAKPVFEHLFGTIPDFKAELQELIAEGDKVVARSILTGTHNAKLLGVEATGCTIRIQAIDIHQVQDGKIVRTWHVEDWATALGQMGALSGD
ncbi:ester cyclase [Argonema galeatum]|uniref:ester cyclase n=1 Tax=Argonema galeatum TaxID=2942762 RepID=UPI002012B87A|nr:ester cyclase [Argonema galeatum]MCL1466748.1 ester cyclase [Argonema galeatum A003/A1]